jgi:hypothetical protein
MWKFTLDTNCWIAVEENRPEAADIRALANAHAAGVASVAIVAISASEKQKDGRHLRNFQEFQERLNSLGLGHLAILSAIGYTDVSFFDRCIWANESIVALERKIHEILFPDVEFTWCDYCRANGFDPKSAPSGEWRDRWRNCKCDVQAMWSHIHYGRDIFVTSDSKFHAMTKKPALVALGARRIEYPKDAVSLMP